MALHIYRFRSQGPSVDDLAREVPGVSTFQAATAVFMDIQVDDANLPDLQDAMSIRGWTLDSTDPTITAATQTAQETPPLFAGVAAALAAADGDISLNGWRITDVADPLAAQDVATKAYVDSAASSAVTAGAGLTKTGATIDVGANADGSIVVNANDIQVGVLATDAQHGQRGGGDQHTEATTAVAGFMSAADKLKLDAISTTVRTDTLTWGNWTIGSTASAKYLAPGYNDTTAAIYPHSFRVPSAGTLSNMRVHHGTAGSNATSLTYALRINGVVQSLVVTMPSNGVDGSELVETAAVSAGDLIDIQVTKGGSTTSPKDITVTLEFGL